MDLKPRIAVFDSGIGGTGVLEAIRERAPWADLVYVADHAFGPFGERTLDEVRFRTEVLARYLTSVGVEMIVIACNSASAAALHHLRSVLPDVPIVGMEPAVKPAAERTTTGVIAVMATGATFQGELFRDLVGRHGSDVAIVEQACPGLAAAVESGIDVGPLLDTYLPNIAASGADVVVLGCTHYPLIREAIAQRLPAGTELIDPAPAVARRVIDVAHERGIDLRGAGATWWWSTARRPGAIGTVAWEAVDVDPLALVAVRIGETTLDVVVDDITAMDVDVVANAANPELVHGGGVAGAIASAGGPTIDEESAAWIATYGPLEPGVAALTSAGAMPARYVVHVAGPVFTEGQDNESLLAAAILAALDMADEIDGRSIAIPAVSAGIYGYPAGEATRIIAESVAEHLGEGRSSLASVHLVGFDEAMGERFAAAVGALDVEP